ncbi:MAG: hypothetical protein NVS9B6_10850 [Candidatus Limnocylindrales bacterium]
MAEKTTVKKTTATKATAAKAAAPTSAAAPAKAAAPVKKTTAAKKTVAKKTAARKTVAKTTAPAVRAVAAPKRARPVKRLSAAPSGTTEQSWRRTRRRTKVGSVISAKQAHTVIVEVERLREHPLYKKVVRVRKKFAAHDAAGDVKAGDLVRIQESRPFSATKRFQVVEVLSRAGEAGAAAPKVADVERQLEASEGSGEMLVRIAEPTIVAAAEPADGNDEGSK